MEELEGEPLLHYGLQAPAPIPGQQWSEWGHPAVHPEQEQLPAPHVQSPGRQPGHLSPVSLLLLHRLGLRAGACSCLCISPLLGQARGRKLGSAPKGKREIGYRLVLLLLFGSHLLWSIEPNLTCKYILNLESCPISPHPRPNPCPCLPLPGPSSTYCVKASLSDGLIPGTRPCELRLKQVCFGEAGVVTIPAAFQQIDFGCGPFSACTKHCSWPGVQLSVLSILWSRSA